MVFSGFGFLTEPCLFSLIDAVNQRQMRLWHLAGNRIYQGMWMYFRFYYKVILDNFYIKTLVCKDLFTLQINSTIIHKKSIPEIEPAFKELIHRAGLFSFRNFFTSIYFL